MLVLFASHQFSHELITFFDYFTDFFSLLLFRLFLRNSFVFSLFLNFFNRVSQRIGGGSLFDGRFVQREDGRFKTVTVRYLVFVRNLVHFLLFFFLLPDEIVQGIQLDIAEYFLLISQVLMQKRKPFLVFFENH